jgi:hypothetical protein
MRWHRGEGHTLSYMKKIVASVGFVALGAASIQAQYAPNLTPQELAKPWSLSASLRGFYDDNFLTQPATYPTGATAGNVPGGTPLYAHPLSSYGIEVSPSAAFNHSTADTLVSASYLYDLKHYFDHDYNEQAHQANIRLEHEFSEKYKLSVADSFVVAQEPTLIDPAIVSTPLLAEGNNVHNTGTVGFNAEMTKLLDLHLGYENNLYAYRQVGGDETIIDPATGGAVAAPYTYASRSAALDRMEQLATIDLRWKALPDTTGVLGYQYGHTAYTSPEYIIYPGVEPTAPGGFRANSRNSDQDFAYVGADYSFTPDVNGSLRAGAEYIDYYNIPTDKVAPYVDASITDTYLPRCTAQLGVKHIHSSTDVVGQFGTGTPVLDSDTTAAYLSVNHEIGDRLTLGAMGQAQFSSFNGGGVGFDGKGEDFFVAGVNATYHVNQFVSTEAGYNYSKLNSDLPDRSYTRNFLYIGVRATY